MDGWLSTRINVLIPHELGLNPYLRLLEQALTEAGTFEKFDPQAMRRRNCIMRLCLNR